MVVPRLDVLQWVARLVAIRASLAWSPREAEEAAPMSTLVRAEKMAARVAVRRKFQHLLLVAPKVSARSPPALGRAPQRTAMLGDLLLATLAVAVAVLEVPVATEDATLAYQSAAYTRPTPFAPAKLRIMHMGAGVKSAMVASAPSRRASPHQRIVGMEGAR